MTRGSRTQPHRAVHKQQPWNHLGSAVRYWDMDPPTSRLTPTPGNQGSCNQRPWHPTPPMSGLALAPGLASHTTGWASAPGSTELWSHLPPVRHQPRDSPSPGPTHQQANTSSGTPWDPQPVVPETSTAHQQANTSCETPCKPQSSAPGSSTTHEFWDTLNSTTSGIKNQPAHQQAGTSSRAPKPTTTHPRTQLHPKMGQH